jgi:hypothetical protein
MLTDRGLGQRQYFYYLVTEASVNFLQIVNNHNPGRMPQSFAHGGKMLGVHFIGQIRSHVPAHLFHYISKEIRIVLPEIRETAAWTTATEQVRLLQHSWRPQVDP